MTARPPFDDIRDLPVPEVGDFASFETEPEYGDPDAPAPELERLDLEADEPDDVARREALE